MTAENGAGWAVTLTQRQKIILTLVTRDYIRTGTPVSSKTVAGLAGFKVSASTVRNEFVSLEEGGYLTHPYTSAGRLPTSQGYREFVNRLIGDLPGREPGVAPVQLLELAKEVDVALQQTSESMSQATNLLALVVAPRVSGTRVRHVELLRLQPNLVMVVFILSTGRVTKKVIDFSRAIDTGMVSWARTYLNEVIGDRILTGRLVRKALDNQELSVKEAAFVRSLLSAFDKLLDEQSEEALYVGGATRLLSESHVQDVEELRDLLILLEERYHILRMLRSALNTDRVIVSIGEENQAGALRNFSLVAASYGLPQRSLGTVSLLGPMRMDYEVAISTVRSTAQLLSAFLGDQYE